MDRRELLGLLGATGAGLTLGQSVVHGEAEHHGTAGESASPYMAPMQGIHAHFCGIHVAKQNPSFQIVSQHYCAARSEEMHQCLLYDSYQANAKLLGVEYIISDRLYRGLPDDEKKYWHPHTYEVLSGGLIAPDMPRDQEREFMKDILTTWGKTWHTWPDPNTPVPLGEPLLIWSLTGDGQVDPDLLTNRDCDFGVSSDQIRAERMTNLGWEVPQVSLPTSLDQIGRQWTNEGGDFPTPID